MYGRSRKSSPQIVHKLTQRLFLRRGPCILGRKTVAVYAPDITHTYRMSVLTEAMRPHLPLRPAGINFPVKTHKVMIPDSAETPRLMPGRNLRHCSLSPLGSRRAMHDYLINFSHLIIVF